MGSKATSRPGPSGTLDRLYAEQPLTRRAALRRASGARFAALGIVAGAGLSACARPLLGVGLPTIVVRSEYLSQLAASLERSWATPGVRARLSVRPLARGAGTVGAYEATGDILDVTPGELRNMAARNFVALGPILTAQNFNAQTLMPNAVAAYRDGSALRGLPLIVGEWQFYTNPTALHKLGIRPPAAWTWRTMLHALDVAVAKGASATSVLVAGTGWGEYALWGALVLGLGGSLTSAGALDLSGAVAATTHLAAVARHAGWHPDPQSNPDNGPWWDFYLSGFSGAAGSALFAFLQPMRIYPGSVPPALAHLPTVAFPRLPVRPVVPAYRGSGLAISPDCRRPELAGAVLAWLYQPAQQRLLASRGWPPVVLPVARKVWPRVDAALPAFWAKFDPARYVDVFYLLTRGLPTNEFLLNQAVATACQAIYDGAPVRTELLALQRQLTRLIGHS